MSKYKLLQKYPSLPKDWEVGMLVGIGDVRTTYSPCIGGYKNFYMNKEEVENNSTFWELQEDKLWEILEFITPAGSIMRLSLELAPLYCTNANVCLSESELSESKTIKIHSIKRLSDGEVFTVGDIVSYGQKEKNIITEFYILNRISGLHEIRVVGERFSLGINNVQKVKTPLFVTEDGEEIFEFTDRKFAFVINDKYHGVYVVNETHVSQVLPTKRFKVFANLENAKKHENENTILYTLNQVKSAVNNWSTNDFNTPIEEIKSFLNKEKCK